MSASDQHRPPQTPTDPHRPAQTSTDTHRPVQTPTDLHRPAQTSTDLHRPAQTPTDQHRPHRPAQTSHQLLGALGHQLTDSLESFSLSTHHQVQQQNTLSALSLLHRNESDEYERDLLSSSHTHTHCGFIEMGTLNQTGVQSLTDTLGPVKTSLLCFTVQKGAKKTPERL